MKFEIKYGLGGGFGGSHWQDVPEIIEAKDHDAASMIAWEMACENYESYAGMHGLRDHDMIIEEEGIDNGNEEEDYNEANEYYEEERESWLCYDAREVKEEEEDV